MYGVRHHPPSDLSAGPAPVVEVEEGPEAGRGEKILIVEAEESLRTMPAIILRPTGYEVRTASNAGEALLIV